MPHDWQALQLRSVLKPMLYKKPKGGQVKLKVKPPVPPRLFLKQSSDEEEFPGFYESPRPSPRPLVSPGPSSHPLGSTVCIQTIHMQSQITKFQGFYESPRPSSHPLSSPRPSTHRLGSMVNHRIQSAMPDRCISPLAGLLKRSLTTILEGNSDTNYRSTPQMGKTQYSSMFHTPTSRMPKPTGRMVSSMKYPFFRLDWLIHMQTFVRKHLHSLLWIKHTGDISKYSDKIFASGTPLQGRMAAYKEHSFGEPDLEPMQVNWKVFNGKWNEKLCELFLQHCIKEGFSEGNPNDDELQLVADMFWECLGRISSWTTRMLLRKRRRLKMLMSQLIG